MVVSHKLVLSTPVCIRCTKPPKPFQLVYPTKTRDPTIRGGVEDTRLEAKAKAKDTKKIRGQGQGQEQPFRGQTLSRPRTGMLEAKDQGHKAQVLSKKKKKRSSQKFFKRSSLKNVFQKIFQALHKISTFQKIVLSSSRGQANFRGLEASRPRPRPRTWPSRPRTSKSVLEDVLEAKDVLEDSTSAYNIPVSYFIRIHAKTEIFLFGGKMRKCFQ